MSKKLTVNDRFKQDISLTELSEQVYDEVITMQFINFYNKGAVTAALLDIRLLELSEGKKGLREIFLDLLDRYGKDKPFPEDEFFKIFVDLTYPEVEQFINNYIKGTRPLPYEEYMAKLGFKYIPERPSEDTDPSLGLQMGINDKQQFTIVGVNKACSDAGLHEGDVPITMMGTEVSMETARHIFGQLHSMRVGDLVDIVVRRGEEEIEVKIPLQQKTDTHIFEEMENLTSEQKMLRNSWSKNL